MCTLAVEYDEAVFQSFPLQYIHWQEKLAEAIVCGSANVSVKLLNPAAVMSNCTSMCTSVYT